MSIFVIIAVLLATATGGSSNIQLDRTITGTISDDGQITVEMTDVTPDNGIANVTFSITNNHATGPLTQIEVQSGATPLATTTETIPPNERTEIAIDQIACGDEIQMMAWGEDFSAETTRTVSC